MKKWWGALALKNKLQIPVQMILMLVLLAGQHFAFDWFEERMQDEVRQKAELTAELTFRSMNALMLNGEIGNLQRRRQILDSLIKNPQLGVAELRLLRGKPVTDQFGPGMDREQAHDGMEIAALSGAGTQVGQITRAGDRVTMRVVVPFMASRDRGGIDCLQCHRVQEGAINGAVSVVTDMSQEYAFISRANVVLWSAQIFIQLVLFFVVGWVINHVIQPVKDLQQSMLYIQNSGDLTRRAPAGGNDEIGQTSRAFDSLMDALSEALRRVHAGAQGVMDTAERLSGISGK